MIPDRLTKCVLLVALGIRDKPLFPRRSIRPLYYNWTETGLFTTRRFSFSLTA